MNAKEIKTNARIQIEIEHEILSYRNLRGIVISVQEDKILLLTDYGEEVEIFKTQILSFSVTSFPRLVSEVLQEFRNQYEKKFILLGQVQEIDESMKIKIDELHDAQFLSKFNIEGAITRLEYSMPDELRKFRSKSHEFEFSFNSNDNEEIEMHIAVKQLLDSEHLDIERDVEKILRAYAPNSEELLKKTFNLEIKSSRFEQKDQGLIHIKESMYFVRTRYRMCFSADKENFLDLREHLFRVIRKIKT